LQRIGRQHGAGLVAQHGQRGFVQQQPGAEHAQHRQREQQAQRGQQRAHEALQSRSRRHWPAHWRRLSFLIRTILIPNDRIMMERCS
jgi:hypothetical protein